MTLQVAGCIGGYDFEQILYFAKKRFLEGCDTVTLLKQAHSDREKEEIILISLLNVDDDQIQELQLTCPHACDCAVRNCRQRLKQMFKEQLN